MILLRVPFYKGPWWFRKTLGTFGIYAILFAIMARHINLQLIMPSDGIDPIVMDKINNNSRMIQEYLNQDAQNITRSHIKIDEIPNNTYKFIFDKVYPVKSLFHTVDKDYNPNDEMFGKWDLVSTVAESFGTIYTWKRTN